MSIVSDTYKENIQSHLFPFSQSYNKKQTGHSSLSRSYSMQSMDPIEIPKEVHRTDNTTTVAANVLPLPDWPTAIEKWGVFWHFHVYGLAAVFLLMTLVSCAIFIRFWWRVQKFKIVFNSLILIALSGILRAIFFLVDPYGSKGLMVSLMTGILMQAVYPLFCAGYGLTQVMLLRTTKVDVGSSKVRSLSWLMGWTLTYMFLVVIIESLVSFQHSLKILLLLDSGCFIAWSLYLGITFICSGFRLSQYANEAKRARKELNAFTIKRRFTNSNTSINDTSLTSFDHNTIAGINPREENLVPNAVNTAEVNDCSLAPQHTQSVKNSVRLFRPKLKFSDKQHMMVTIASDEDDVSTSSTDVDKEILDHTRCFRKHYKHKRRRRNVKDTSPTSSYIALATTGEVQSRHKENSSTLKKRNPTIESLISSKVVESATRILPMSTVETIDSYGIILKDTAIHYPMCNFKNDNANTSQSYVNNIQRHELPLLQTPSSRFGESLNLLNDVSKPESIDSSNEDDVRCETRQRIELNHSSNAETNTNSAFIETEFCSDFSNDTINDHSYSSANKKLSNHQYPIVSQTEIYIQSEHGCLSSSPKDNGYMADTEHAFYCPSISKTLIFNDNSSQANVDLSQRSTPTCSDEEDSVKSRTLSNKMISLTPTSLGLFRIRQSKMVQKALHLTYFLTFLFLFACLLQLYTVFGVYGVLATIPKPDPWPWLIFHSIFRASEISIGFTILLIAFDNLNHRQQRTKRRKEQQQQQQQHQQQQQQQQQHQQHPTFGDCSRDCN